MLLLCTYKRRFVKNFKKKFIEVTGTPFTEAIIKTIMPKEDKTLVSYEFVGITFFGKGRWRMGKGICK